MELKMQLLLGAGADINAHANNGYTAIHMACQSHNHSGAKFLLSNGADPCSKNKNGHTAFSFGHVRENDRLVANCRECEDLKLAHCEELRSRNAVLERSALSMTSLLFSDDFSDVEVVCGGDCERIPAHRCILAACSQPLRASLLGPWAESVKREVEMSQSGAAVRVLLRFMYTCEAEAAALDDNLHEVLELAALYEQADLKAACEERCLAGLQNETVVHLRDIASHHNLKKVTKACIRYMNENMVQLEDLGLVVVYKLRDGGWTKTSSGPPHGVKRAASEIYEIYDASEDI
jgi:hypothetical protein